MTSKLDRRYSALVEVLFPEFILHTISYSCMNTGKSVLLNQIFSGFSGSIMWFDHYRGAASRHVDSHGVLSHGVRIVQAVDSQSQSEKPLESVLHCSRASVTGKHGVEVKTNKNTNLVEEDGWEEQGGSVNQ